MVGSLLEPESGADEEKSVSWKEIRVRWGDAIAMGESEARRQW
jgi:hypothetical protein